MADLTITASSVVPGAGAVVKSAIAAVAITAGQLVYIDANGQAALADANAATTDNVVGMATNNAAASQPVNYVAKGLVDVGSVLTAAAVYVLSSTARGICPVADLGSTEYTTIIGVAVDANTLEIDIKVSGVVTA